MNFTRSVSNLTGAWKTCASPCTRIRFRCALDRARYVYHPSSTQRACGGVTILRNTNMQRKMGSAIRNLHVASANAAGHNKWSKIKRKKAVTDMEKSRMRGKLLDQIRTAVASGGVDPTTNVKLSGLLTLAKSGGVPKANIEAALKSGSGSDGAVREMVMYEGRGPSGYLVLIEALTDNRNRTRPEIRHIMEKQGGILGEPGSSAFVFEHKGIIQLSSNDQQLSDVDPLELAIEVGAEDVNVELINVQNEEERVIQLKCEPNELNTVCSAVTDRGLVVSSAELDYFPKLCVPLIQDQFEKAEKLVELLSEQCDVVSVYSNHELAGD